MDSEFLRADELGIRLEIVAGLPNWATHPRYRHQKAIDRIRATIQQNNQQVPGKLTVQCPYCRCVRKFP